MSPRHRIRILAIASVVASLAGCRPAGPTMVRDERLLMGTTFRIQAVTATEAEGRKAVEAAFAEVDRVEQLLSEWKETSQISEVNRAAGREPVRVGPEMLTVAGRALEFGEITGGAFDITFAACGGLWSFREQRAPSSEALNECLRRVGYRNLRVDTEASTIFLPEPGMRIGIAGIGKGYGVDRAAAVLEARGITDYVVDGGGDIRLRGRKPGGPWSVGIAHPRRSGELLGTLSLDRGAIVTSGDYYQFFERDGVRYHHILDPRTGRPARKAVSVTVLAPDATEADALATGLFVMGPRRGLALAESLPDVEALILGPDLSEHRSSGFPSLQPSPAAAR